MKTLLQNRFIIVLFWLGTIGIASLSGAFLYKHRILASLAIEQAAASMSLLPPPDTSNPFHYAFFHTLDENSTHAGYPYVKSITAQRDLFIERAKQPAKPNEPDAAREILDRVHGVSRFGSGYELLSSEAMQPNKAGGLRRIEFSFGEGGFGQAIVGEPENPNGRLLIAISGCAGVPDIVMVDGIESYANSFGIRAMERGYTVVAPMLQSHCHFIHNLDYVGSMSGVSSYGYDVAKILALTAWAKDEFSPDATTIWGISLGGHYSMYASALDTDGLFDISIVSGANGDPRPATLAQYEDAGLSSENGKLLGFNTQVFLMADLERLDLMRAILPRPIIFESSFTEWTDSAKEIYEQLGRDAKAIGAPVPLVNAFEGVHETNPKRTLDLLDDAHRALSGQASPSSSISGATNSSATAS